MNNRTYDGLLYLPGCILVLVNSDKHGSRRRTYTIDAGDVYGRRHAFNLRLDLSKLIGFNLELAERVIEDVARGRVPEIEFEGFTLTRDPGSFAHGLGRFTELVERRLAREKASK